MSQITMLNADEFSAQVEGGEGLTLVDYYADWCGPCKMVAPVLEQLSDEYEGKVSIVKINADLHPEVLGKYGVRGLPTMMLFDDGKPVEMAVGAQPYSSIKSLIERGLA